MMKTRFGIFLVSLGLMGFSTGELVELSQDMKGRKDPRFLKQIHNLRFLLPKGTQGEIKEIHSFKKTGNFGLKIEVRNGRHQGKSVWVYFDTKNPGMKILDDTPVKGKQVLTTRELPAVQEPQPQDDSEIKTSNIDLPSALTCHHALSSALGTTPETNYPEGYLALPGQNHRHQSGALLFGENQVRFFKGLQPNENGQFFEFIGTSPDYFAVPTSQGEVIQSPEIRGRLATKLRDLLQSTRSLALQEPKVASTAPDDPLTEKDQEVLKSMLQRGSVDSSPRAREHREPPAPRIHDIYFPSGKDQKIQQRVVNDRLNYTVIKNKDTLSTALPSRLKIPDVIQALEQCKKVREEPRVSALAAELLERWSPPFSSDPPQKSSKPERAD